MSIGSRRWRPPPVLVVAFDPHAERLVHQCTSAPVPTIPTPSSMHQYYHPGAPLSASDLDRLDGTDQWAALISTDPGDIGSRLEVLLNVDPTNNQGDINSSVLNDPAGTENKLHARTATTVRAFKCVRPRSPPSAAPGAHLNPHTYALEPIHAGWSGYAGIVTSDGWKLTLGDPGKQNNTQLRARARAPVQSHARTHARRDSERVVLAFAKHVGCKNISSRNGGQ